MGEQETLLTAPALQREYQQWRLSQSVLASVYELPTFRQMDLHSLEACLENTLMGGLLHCFNGQLALWRSLSAEQWQRGCAEAGNSISQQDAEAAQALTQQIITHWEEQPALDQTPQLVISEGLFTLGDFELERIRPVEKAYSVLLRKHHEEQAAEILLTSALRYASLYSKTRHIGPPQKVYDYFYQRGVRNEGFASPFNARLLGKPEAQFYSLFKDTDQELGSGGSFFSLEKPLNPGHWSLDPPFIPATMQRVDEMIGRWRKQYPEMAILYIVPASHKPAVQPDQTVLLKAGIHHYEGLDHSLHPLPVDVTIHRYGNMRGFSEDKIVKGYKK